LRMCTTKSGNVANIQPSISTLLDDCCVLLHCDH
jgi:hypothetical protein